MKKKLEEIRNLIESARIDRAIKELREIIKKINDTELRRRFSTGVKNYHSNNKKWLDHTDDRNPTVENKAIQVFLAIIDDLEQDLSVFDTKTNKSKTKYIILALSGIILLSAILYFYSIGRDPVVKTCQMFDTLRMNIIAIDDLKRNEELDMDDLIILDALKEKFELYLNSHTKCEEINKEAISQELQHLYDIQKKYQQ